MRIIDIKLSEESLITKLVHNAMLLNQHKSKKFLQKLFDMDELYFFNDSETPTQHIINEFFKLLDLFEAKYKDNFDLGFDFDGFYLRPYFKVLYPKFTITNSNNNSHIIRDLVVIHKVAYKYDSLDEGHIFTKHPLGGRLSKTILEISACYQQSHLLSVSNWHLDPLSNFSSFCVGGDTDVSRMIAEFQVEMDWDRYELYLFCIDSMITWESLEGVPYKRISEIKNSLNKRVFNCDPRYKNRVVDYITANEIPLDFNFYIKNNRYHIRPDEKANSFIKKIILEIFSFSEYKSIIVSRMSNTFDQYLEFKTEDANPNLFSIEDKNSYFIFRGKKIYPKVIKEYDRNKKIISIDDHIVYPKFLKDVLRELEYRIYEKAITKSGIKLQNSISNANRSITSNTVSV